MTTGPAGKHSTSGACSARSRTAANPLPSRSASDGWSSGPTPGSTTSADSVAAPNAGRPASTPTLLWPPPSSPSVHCGGPHGSSTAGTPGQDHHASADLLADALSTRESEQVQRPGRADLHRLDRQPQVVHRGRGAREVEDVVDGAHDVHVARDVVLHEPE